MGAGFATSEAGHLVKVSCGSVGGVVRLSARSPTNSMALSTVFVHRESARRGAGGTRGEPAHVARGRTPLDMARGRAWQDPRSPSSSVSVRARGSHARRILSQAVDTKPIFR